MKIRKSISHFYNFFLFSFSCEKETKHFCCLEFLCLEFYCCDKIPGNIYLNSAIEILEKVLKHVQVVNYVQKLQASTFNFTKSNTPPWVFSTFSKLHKWYQITQSISYVTHWFRKEEKSMRLWAYMFIFRGSRLKTTLT